MLGQAMIQGERVPQLGRSGKYSAVSNPVGSNQQPRLFIGSIKVKVDVFLLYCFLIFTVVTGATDGIGKAYAEELAKRDFNVILISRTLEKLKNVAKGIEQQTRRKTKVIQLDFTGGPEIYPKVEQELKNMDIGILVNNVGIMYNDEGRFLEVSDFSEVSVMDGGRFPTCAKPTTPSMLCQPQDNNGNHISEQMELFLPQWISHLGHLVLSYLVLKQLWKVLNGIRVHIISRVWRTDLKKYGGWAVVTGATDGIGKAYVEELAKRGFDVVLISRTLEKLKNVAKGIEQQTGRKTKVIQLDFSGGPEIYPKVEQELKDLDIGILVNNVGMTYSEVPVTLLSVPDANERIPAIMNCNVTSAVQMTKIVLSKMIQRKKGLIINISSEIGSHPFPMMTMYSSTKVFLDYFSRALNTEYKSKGITVQSVMPLAVSTNMTRRLKSNIFVKTANDFAREALNTVGYTHRTNGCLSHAIQSYFLQLIVSDSFLGSRMMASVTRKIRKSAMERARRKQQ
ncbi:very-long-chain 3-oxoacyl-CoA reductase-B-like [Hyla sarda]|uniref:very-long-chain 3-oxoacyl-CoA reductase-B-like n=1 Tax=Hyla sarda TaxID=327740 RepID=UPI0024C35A5E|nr:very-long-chain 3-oxoacyl-CoA reductase-B-like [Hyla sarda]